jgi:DNA-binding NtrC family response regulator
MGETGTGKEPVACYIYEQSRRSNGPFIAVIVERRQIRWWKRSSFG